MAIIFIVIIITILCLIQTRMQFSQPKQNNKNFFLKILNLCVPNRDRNNQSQKKQNKQRGGVKRCHRHRHHGGPKSTFAKGPAPPAMLQEPKSRIRTIITVYYYLWSPWAKKKSTHSTHSTHTHSIEIS